MGAPDIATSTKAERLAYINEKFRCIANCAICGNCKILRGMSADEAYAEYIEGRSTFVEVSMTLRDC